MKFNAFPAVMAAVCLAAPATAAFAAEQPLHLLYFGNSFTRYTSDNINVPVRVERLAVADGHAAPVWVAQSQSGSNLAYHLGELTDHPANTVAHSALPAGQTWDAVVIQGHSLESNAVTGDTAAFANNAQAILQAVRADSRGAGAAAVLYQTWARGQGDEVYPATFTSPTAMHEQVRAAYHDARAQIDAALGPGSAFIAPVGDGFAALDHDPAYYAGDLHHASVAGYTLSALLIYRTLYAEDVSDIAYAGVADWVRVSESQWQALTTLADTIDVHPVVAPEPGTAALSLLVLGCLLSRRR